MKKGKKKKNKKKNRMICFPILFIFIHSTKPDAKRNEWLSTVLTITINRMRFDEETYDFDADGDDEIEFANYRTDMKTLLLNIFQLVS